IITHAILVCLGEYSHANNLPKRLLSLFLYSNGISHQTISVMSSLGVTESYSNLMKYTGTLRQLSEAMQKQAHKLTATGLYGVVYDNINMYSKNAEQILSCYGEASLEAYSEKTMSWEILVSHAESIVKKYANAATITDLCYQHNKAGDLKGDMILENSILFMQDALLSHEFTDAVKMGDSGQLVNPSGKHDAFNELDLVQEHLNYWIKLVSNFHNTLGSDQGTKHAEPDLSKDIQTLMDTLDEYNVYQLQPGCALKGEGQVVPDVIAVGYANLTESSHNLLDEYNNSFQELQEMHHCTPVTQAMVDSLCSEPELEQVTTLDIPDAEVRTKLMNGQLLTTQKDNGNVVD
ncbi:hypothetical protein AN958_05211, partial [Leucoagaricus sp. SymC.cos]